MTSTRGRLELERRLYAPRSRFLPNQLLGHFARSAVSPADDGAPAAVTLRRPRVDIGTALVDMWG